MNERRLESRFLCADLVKVDWISGESGFRTVEAVLEDISAVGACVQVEERIPPGAAISIKGNDAAFFGIVSYCVYRDYGYFVGIRLSEDTRWSKGVFNPRHLTNPRDLSE
jgi:hypothetical protein